VKEENPWEEEDFDDEDEMAIEVEPRRHSLGSKPHGLENIVKKKRNERSRTYVAKPNF